MSESRRRRIINNSNMNNMYRIITDTVNQIEAMTSVDDVTKGAEDKASGSRKAVEEYLAGPGNFVSIGEGIANNYVGKDGISRSAATLKVFFKVTQYLNTILNSGNSDRQSQIFNFPQDLLDKCGNYKPRLANIRALDPDTITHIDTLLSLAENNNLKDAAAELSALLGLSADNAKKLVLAKLNAGLDMIGMYLYGICIGYDIPTLAEVLMSDAAEIIQETMQSNLFNGDQNIKINKVFDTYLWGPSKQLSKFNKIIKRDTNESNSKYISNSVDRVTMGILADTLYTLDPNMFKKSGPKMYGEQHNYLLDIYRAMHPDEPIKGSTKKPEELSFFSSKHLAYALVQVVSQLDTEQLVLLLNRVKEKVAEHMGSNNERKYLANQMLNFIEDFYYSYKKIHNPKNYEAYKALQILAAGSQSMQQIGAIVGLNKGIPGLLDDFTNKIRKIEDYLIEQKRSFERLVYDDYSQMKEAERDDLKVDLTRFVSDPQYRYEKIEQGQKYVMTFNLLDLIDTLPDIQGYVNGLYVIDYFMKSASSRYRELKSKHDYVQDKYRLGKDTDQAISKRITHTQILSFLRDLSMDPKFQIITDMQMTQHGPRQLNSGYKIDFTTADGIATFKYWMEKKVLPYLKKTYGSSNMFLRDIQGNSRTNTLSGNEIDVWALGGVNMLPQKGSNEEIVFNKYLASFQAIDLYYSDPSDPNKTNFKVKDLLFLYTLIAHEWQQSQSSFVSLFLEDSVDDTSLTKKYLDSVHSKESIAIDDLGIVLPEEIYYAGKSRYKNPNSPYIFAYNPDTGLRELWKRDSTFGTARNTYYNDENSDMFDDDNPYDQAENLQDVIGDDEEEGRVYKVYKLNGYSRYYTPDPNYYIFGNFEAIPIVDEADVVKYGDGKNGPYTVNYSDSEKTIQSVIYGDYTIEEHKKNPNDISLEELTNAGIITIVDGKQSLDISKLDDYIDQKENKQPKCDIPPF